MRLLNNIKFKFMQRELQKIGLLAADLEKGIENLEEDQLMNFLRNVKQLGKKVRRLGLNDKLKLAMFFRKLNRAVNIIEDLLDNCRRDTREVICTIPYVLRKDVVRACAA